MMIEPLDFRPICRDVDKHGLRVSVRDPHTAAIVTWIEAGESDLRSSNDRTQWDLTARLGPSEEGHTVPTDFEHDSAYAFCLPLIGVRFDMAMGHNMIFTAWINPRTESFGVPPADYDPRKHPRTTMCTDKDCIEGPLEHGFGPHMIVPEGFYIPEHNAKLFEQMRGLKVEIVFERSK